MLDPFTGWLSHVDLLLAVVVSIFAKIAVISFSADRALGLVLSMCNRVRKFRRSAVAPTRPRKRVGRGRAKLHGPTDPSNPT